MRAGPLSDASIASILNRFYVPVFTANEEYEKTGSAPPEERAAHRRIYLEFLEKKLGTGSFHVYLLAPDGSAIGGLDIGSATQTDKLLARLESTVRQLGTPAGGPLILPGPQSRAPRSYREELVLHLTARGFNQGSWREFPGENWLVLRKRDWSRFLPTPDRPLTVGQSWDLEPRVTTPIYHRFHPQTEDTHDDTARNRIEEQSLRATLVRVDDERGLVWLRGQLRMGRPFYPGRPDATPIQSGVAGFVEFDPRNRRIVDLQLVSENATFGKEGFGVALRTARAPREPLPPGQEQVLFDFEEPDAAEGWNAGPVGESTLEPAPQARRAAEQARSGRHSLRITFEGGQWPGLETDRIPADWSDYQSFHADVTVREPSLIGFQVLQEKSSTGRGWDAGVTRWVKTEFLRPGTTTVSAPLHPNDWTALRPELGRNLAFRVFLYRPRAGQVLFLDRVRLSTTPAAVEKPRTEFTVLGTREKVENVQELDRRWKERWRVPTPTSVEAVEAAFRARLEELRRTHPDTMLSLLRDGETGWDPARPERVYDGWRDAYWSSHGPDALTEDRAENRGAAATHEVFMRHRSPLMRVELGSIPPGSEILHAELLLVRSTDIYEAERHPQRNPNMWVAEACNRPWVEQEVNAYEYARGKFWRAVGGMDWAGPNPDFLPLYLAHGPGNGRVTTWDFTEAVRFWTAGRNPNHGFMLHCDANDWLQSAWTREAPIRRNRPALLVLYRPARR